MGEILLRLDPGEGRIKTARHFAAWEGGGEYNVARGLRKCFGMKTSVITAFTNNEVGRLLEDMVSQGGVDTSLIRWLDFDGIGRSSRNAINFTERGFGKRVPYTDYEPQARGGKGVKTFYYQKSGSNGTRIAGAALITAPGQNVVIHQKTSKPTQLSADEVILQSKQDRGMPYVMALMDDTVTGVTIV